MSVTGPRRVLAVALLERLLQDLQCIAVHGRGRYRCAAPAWEDVGAIGLRLPGVEVGTSFRTPALKVRGKGMCRLRTTPAALVLRVIDMGEREALLQGQPDVFFSTPHFDGWPYVLVRLEAVDPVELQELLEDAWRVFAAERVVSRGRRSGGRGERRALGAQSLPAGCVGYPSVPPGCVEYSLGSAGGVSNNARSARLIRHTRPRASRCAMS